MLLFLSRALRASTGHCLLGCTGTSCGSRSSDGVRGDGAVCCTGITSLSTQAAMLSGNDLGFFFISCRSWRKRREVADVEDDPAPICWRSSSSCRMYRRASQYFVFMSSTSVSSLVIASRFFLRDAAALSRFLTRRASFLQALSSSFVMETPGSYRDCLLIPVICGFFRFGWAVSSNAESSADQDATVTGSSSSSEERVARERLLLPSIVV